MKDVSVVLQNIQHKNTTAKGDTEKVGPLNLLILYQSVVKSYFVNTMSSLQKWTDFSENECFLTILCDR